MMADLSGPNTTPTRYPDRVTHGHEEVYSLLDESLVSQVAYVHDDLPRILPLLHIRLEQMLYFHMSSGSHMALLLQKKSELQVCVSCVMVDGLVFATSAIKHSINHRSLIIHGSVTRVGDECKPVILSALVDKMMPGRSAVCRSANARELAGTEVVGMEIREASVKSRSGGPLLEEEDSRSIWIGEIPVALTARPPRSFCDVPLPTEMMRLYYGQQSQGLSSRL
ncbi:pyridoxamine 5'-phosphate oxidase family protein [Streptomyces virginiae]|uniref:pyridoxamine 5'-phosphate oxidase family protein n=1 Tax=Streptomyces virginiae TaxID=1961 RepID=UPI00224EF523|nr:pyridoxamine 5'-phosphate oxidase family protein [Streptomyces virginiae]MCX5174695.1 pyridoxamine 5'-phosphate oxidase family protein [Streptomyces virginiae]